MPVPDPTDPRAAHRDDVRARAVAAAVGLAREHGLRVDEPRVLEATFSVQVHLHPAPVVAGVSTWAAVIRPDDAAAAALRVAVAEHLTAVGAPVVGVSRELPPGPHERDGFSVTFTEWAPPDEDRAVGVADCVAMLPELHAALATFPGELPVFRPPHVDIPIGLAALERQPDLLTPDERAALHAAHERLGPFLADPGDTTTVLHGDLHPGNLLATGGELRWIDFEDVCRGPVGWDHAMLHWIDADAAAALGDDPELLGPASDLRALHLALCLTTLREHFGDQEGWDGYIRDFLALVRPAAAAPR